MADIAESVAAGVRDGLLAGPGPRRQSRARQQAKAAPGGLTLRPAG